MEYTYNASKLAQTKDEIIQIHTLRNKPLKIEATKELRQFIKKLVELPQRFLKQNALSLSNREMFMLTGYLPYNFFDLKMDNLFKIFRYRTTEEYCRFLFETWQGAYSNTECNEFIKDSLINDNNFIEVIKQNNYSTADYFTIVNSNNISLETGKYIYQNEYHTRESFIKGLTYYGIKKNSRLYNDCLCEVYIYCNKHFYFHTDEYTLLQSVKVYTIEQMKLFMYNLLSRLNIQELCNYRDYSHFRELCHYCMFEIGESDKPSYSKIMKDFPSDLLQKYNDWIINYKIYNFLGETERGTFWRHYRYKSVIRHAFSSSVVLECDNHYIIEFLGKQSGPYYIYPKPYFKNNIEHVLRRYNNTELRQYLYHDYQKDSTNQIIREAHLGYWRGNADALINRHKITTTL